MPDNELKSLGTLDASQFFSELKKMQASIKDFIELGKSLVVNPRVVVDDAGTKRSKKLFDDTADSARALGKAVAGVGGNSRNTAAQTAEVDRLARAMRVAVLEFQGIQGKPSQAQIDATKDRLQALRVEAEKLKPSLDEDSATFEKLVRSVKGGQAAIDKLEGNLPKLGIGEQLKQSVFSALEAFGPLGKLTAALGQNIADGLAQGQKARKAAVQKAAQENAQAITGTIRDELDIHSPSQVMVTIGNQTIEGLELGMKTEAEKVAAIARDIGANIPKAVSEGADSGDTAEAGTNAFQSLLESLSGGLEKIPAVFQKTSTEVASSAKDLAEGVELNVAPAFEGLSAGFEKAASKLEAFPASTRAASEGATEAAQNVAAAGEEAEEAGNGFEKLAGFLTVAAAGVALFTSAIAVALPKAEEYQAAITNIGTESDLTAQQLGDLGGRLLDVSVKTATGAKELAEAAYDVVGAGVKGAETTAQLAKLTEVAAKAGAAGLTETGKAADVITSALNAYGLSAEYATHVSDVLFKTTALGKITFDQIAGSMTEIFPTAKTLGVGLDEVAGAVATLTAVGIPAEKATTGLNAALSNILNPSSEATETAEKLGISFDATALKSMGLAKFLDTVTKATHGNIEQMSSLFGSSEAINAVFALTSKDGAAKFKASLDGLAGAAGATEDAFQKQAGTAQFAQKQFGVAIDALQIQFGLKLLPIITKTTLALTDVISHLDELGSNGVVQFALVVGGAAAATSTFLKLSVAIKEAAGATALFQAASNAGGLTALIGRYGGVAGSLKALTSVAPAAALSLAPVATVAAAVGAAFAGWKIGEAINGLHLLDNDSRTIGTRIRDFFARNFYGVPQDFLDNLTETEEKSKQAAQGLDLEGQALADQINKQLAASQAAERANAQREAQIQKVQEETAAIKDFNKQLADRKATFQIQTGSDFEKQVADIKKTYTTLVDDLKEKVKDPIKLKVAVEAAGAQQDAEIKALRKKAEEEYRVQAEAGERDAQRARVNAMADGRAKRLALLNLDIADAKSAGDKQLRQYEGFSAIQTQIGINTETKIKGLREQFRKDEAAAAEKDARERVKRAQDTARAVVDAEATRKTTQLNTQSTELDNTHASEVQAARGNLAELTRLEEQYAHDRVALNKQLDENERGNRITALQRTLHDGLQAEKLTAGERAALYTAYYTGLETLDEEFRGRASDRAAQQLQLEAQVLEAQRAQAAQPAADAADRVKDLERLKGLTSNTGELLNLEAQRRSALGDEARAIGNQIAQADKLKLSVEEVRKLEADRKDIQAQIAQSLLDEARAAAQRPVDDASQRVKDLERLQSLTGNQEELFALEAKRREALQGQADAIGKQLAGADRLKLSVDDIRSKEEERADLQAAIVKSIKDEARTRAETALSIVQGRLAEVDAQKNAAQTLAGQITLERERRDLLAEQAGRQQGILNNAEALGLTDEQIRGYTKDRAQTLRDIEASLRAERDLNLQILNGERQLALGTAERAVTSARSFADEQVARLQQLDQLQQEYALRQALADQAASEGKDAGVVENLRGDAAAALDKVRTATEAYAQAQDTLRTETQAARDALRGLRDVLDADEVTGVARAERTLAQATAATRDAYRDAEPYLTRLRRGQGLATDELPKAQAAFEKLTGSLTAQRQALEDLRTKYSEARGTVSGIGALLADLTVQVGKSNGTKSILDDAITLNEGIVTRSEQLLTRLFANPKASAADLKGATDDLLGTYQQFGEVIGKVIGTNNRDLIGKVLQDALGNVDQAREALDSISKDPNADPAKLQAGLQALSASYKLYADGVQQATDAQVEYLRAQAQAAEDKGNTSQAAKLRAQADQLASGVDKILKPVRDKIAASLALAGPAGAAALVGLDKLGGEVDGAAAQLGKTIDQIGARVPQVIVDITRQFQDAGLRSGQAFADRFSDVVRQQLARLNVSPNIRVPTIDPTAPGAGGRVVPATQITNFTQTITIDGNDITGSASPNIKQLLNQLRNEAQAECRRQKAKAK